MADVERDDLLRCEALQKDYMIGPRVVHVLRGVNLSVREGEFVSITGVSGCGKSTLLHVLGLVDAPTAGSVFVRGKDVSTQPERQREAIRSRSIGFVFQFYHLLPEFTALENAIMPGLVARRRTRELKREARGLLERVGLGDRLRHYPNQLSGGERQRVAIARALINDPDILLCDEPTGNLDEETGATIVALLDELHRDSRQSLLLVTHDPQIASHAQRTLRLHEGVISPDLPHTETDDEQTFDG